MWISLETFSGRPLLGHQSIQRKTAHQIHRHIQRKTAQTRTAEDRSHFGTAEDRSHFGTAEDRSHFGTAEDRSSDIDAPSGKLVQSYNSMIVDPESYQFLLKNNAILYVFIIV
jgi:hypothetical protein